MQLIANTLTLASTYILLAIGYVVVYRASRVLNLAHGELMMLGGYAFFTLVSAAPGQPIVAVPAALLVSTLVGVLVYLVLMRPMAGHPLFSAVLVTVSLGILVRGLVILGWTADIKYPLAVMGYQNTPRRFPGGAVLSDVDLLSILTAAALLVGLWLFFKKSRLGIQMRATAENPRLAAQGGVNISLVFAVSWAISTFAAGAAGVLYASNVRLDPEIGVIGLKAFPVALVGGLDSLPGVLPAGLIISLLEILAIQYVSPLLSDVVPFLVLLLMLFVRPWGLFGTKEEIERV
ncbi:MAG: branched-chain amino acid ABC transporter permease [Candidatus Methylomirabilia bacterium]